MNFADVLLGGLQSSWKAISPQLFLMIVATLMLWPGDLLFPKGEKHKWSIVTFVAVAFAGLLVFIGPENGDYFNHMYKVDGLARGFQALCALGTLATVVLSQRVLNSLEEQTVEYYALLLYGLSGMFFLCGASDLMTVYFSVELMAICVYILVAYLRTQSRGVEAGLKYFLLGAFSSGILLYGISLVFAAAGGTTTNLAELQRILPTVDNSRTLLVFAGTLMILVGMCFKVAAVPFHMWSPDAYDGAPTPITAWMATAPKAAALAAFLRVFGSAFYNAGDWTLPLQFVAGASMILGNVAAMKQQSMKRLLAYSSIAHVGYMLLGVLANDLGTTDALAASGARAVWLYMLLYVVMNTGAFAIVIHLQGKGEGERIEDFRGLHKTRPMLAFAMMVFLLSLAGIPPLVGFFGKFYLFKLAVERGYTALVVIAMLTSAVSAYYYLGVVNQMYFGEPAEGEAPKVAQATWIIVVASMLLVVVGTAFGPQLLDWTGRVGLERPAPMVGMR
jgi:NADH-quinone oxidoreductase subunit N